LLLVYIATRAEVFRPSPRRATRGIVAAMLEQDSDEEEGGIDCALDRGELEPEAFVCMAARPFPGALEGATIH
jgi:hypothetical protein